MSTLNASWNFLSGLAVQLGAEPVSRSAEKRNSSLFAERLRKKKRFVRRLDKSERQELIDSIRHDDWFE
ncbi:hypothetical protein M2360_001093 [Rhizobium sp. SG_E_25_P2]|uniref:hypothetical protein n=1 Tax=Rhizobium sp. SG_E_25_P2 TaxID=2879942 RepID=UPI0024749F30|nr:hypothetical protein [Rhizobium sp. SG_E_25_P2]MDH6265703.1 hypothetical protein [Rhizobium sp. SG_E_25_P2]